VINVRIKANSFHIPLKDRSVQAVITSPPYWQMREYDIPCINIDGWIGQHGLEPTIDLFVTHAMLWISEVMRVLRDDGVFFLNMGDSYERKHELLMPHRLAIAMSDEGWICRNDIVWHKPNKLPESVKDRFSNRFEYVFMFTKNQKYYFDLDAVRMKTGTEIPMEQYQKHLGEAWGNHSHDLEQGNRFENHVKRLTHPKGKNPGNVWEICSQAYSGSHFATFPEKLVERMLLCSTRLRDVVLDPFAGSGTTGRVAIQYGRKPILLDLGYHYLQKDRLNNNQLKLMV
jgi:DNA modification methylase